MGSELSLGVKLLQGDLNPIHTTATTLFAKTFVYRCQLVFFYSRYQKRERLSIFSLLCFDSVGITGLKTAIVCVCEGSGLDSALTKVRLSVAVAVRDILDM